MKKLLLIISFVSALSFSQQLPPGYFAKERELYFSFPNPGKILLNQISRIISIDSFNADSVYAYANEAEYNNFLKLNIPWKEEPHPGDVKDVRMSGVREEIMEWDTYPTYDAYVNMMIQFSSQYPSLCKLVDAGNTVQGRKIYFIKISDSAAVAENEPDVMLTSTMHGDETTGYVLMLRLINYLLTNYGTNAEVTNLVNGLEIWINPNANPDGTYRSGNSTVAGARRFNANGVDINRNFPDPADGPHPDGYAWQPETLIMTGFMPKTTFVVSVNFHGGTEVVNYPWDTWVRRHPDDAWMQYISHLYADTCQAFSPSTYMRGYNDGITNGYDWYRVAGGRQDYFTYFRRGREVCIEISNTKLLSASLLPAHWEYNYRSFLQYMKNAMHGVRGIVTNIYGAPVKAKIIVNNHDADNSEIFSDSLFGNYHRLIAAGTYTITVTADSHITQVFTNVVVTNQNATELNVQLVPLNYVPVELVSFTAEKINGLALLKWATASEVNNSGFEIERLSTSAGNQYVAGWEKIGFVNGNGTTTEKKEYSFTDDEVAGNSASYRLKQVDLNGSYRYSNSINLNGTDSPGSFVLNQNYPNPFNPATNISYVTTKQAMVRVAVYNSLGQEVELLSDKTEDAGFHNLVWNAGSYTSGNYFCRMTVRNEEGGQDYEEIQKLTLIK